MISARDALSQIAGAIGDVRRDEDRLVAMLASTTAEADRLRTSQAEGFKALARLKLDALARDEVVGELDGAEQRALKALERRRGVLDSANARRSELARNRAALDAAVIARTAARDAAVEAVEDLNETVERRIAADPAWKAADDAVRSAEAHGLAAAEKADRAEADRIAKGKPYEADSLFMYLWTRGYGTPAYRSGGLVRMMDGKVAAVVGYDAARANYFMLTEIPLRLREHAGRQQAAVADAVAAREAIERAALVAAGIDALEDAAEAAEAALVAAVAARDAALAEEAEAETAARDVQSGANDPAFTAAIDDLAKALARDDLRTLYRDALDTPTTEDEAIVKGLQDIERALVRVTAQAEEVRRAAVDVARKRSELEQSEQSFRRKGYDDPMGEFANGAVIGALIEGILRGALSARNLDDTIGSGYRRREPRGNRGDFGGGLRIPRAGSGGGSSSRGKSGGSGFRTGSSF